MTKYLPSPSHPLFNLPFQHHLSSTPLFKKLILSFDNTRTSTTVTGSGDINLIQIPAFKIQKEKKVNKDPALSFTMPKRTHGDLSGDDNDDDQDPPRRRTTIADASDDMEFDEPTTALLDGTVTLSETYTSFSTATPLSTICPSALHSSPFLNAHPQDLNAPANNSNPLLPFATQTTTTTSASNVMSNSATAPNTPQTQNYSNTPTCAVNAATPRTSSNHTSPNDTHPLQSNTTQSNLNATPPSNSTPHTTHKRPLGDLKKKHGEKNAFYRAKQISTLQNRIHSLTQQIMEKKKDPKDFDFGDRMIVAEIEKLKKRIKLLGSDAPIWAQDENEEEATEQEAFSIKVPNALSAAVFFGIFQEKFPNFPLDELQSYVDDTEDGMIARCFLAPQVDLIEFKKIYSAYEAFGPATWSSVSNPGIYTEYPSTTHPRLEKNYRSVGTSTASKGHRESRRIESLF